MNETIMRATLGGGVNPFPIPLSRKRKFLNDQKDWRWRDGSNDENQKSN